MSRKHTQASKKALGTKLGPRLALVRLLGVAAFGLSAYLLWGSWASDHPPGCGPDSGCESVMHSRWASWFGVPVSLPALVLYGSVLTATVGFHQASRTGLQRNSPFLSFSGVILIGAAAWFVGLQLFVIKAICPFCMAAHACGLLVGLLLLTMPSHAETQRPSTGFRGLISAVWDAVRTRSALAGLVAVLVLVGGQVVYRPKTYEVQPLDAGTVGPTALVTSNSAEPTPPPPGVAQSTATAGQAAEVPKKRLLQLHGDLFKLDLNDVPLIGTPDAPCVMVNLFDYSCPLCRRQHPLLLEAQRSLSNRLAIACLPVPLEPTCNPLVKRHMPDHTNACIYARLGLAVWRADRAKFPAFDEWMFAGHRPPSPAEATKRAAQLVGTNVLAARLKDPWIKQAFERNFRLYHTNYLRYQKGRIPQLIIGTNIISGVLRSTNDLYRLLEDQFDLTPPPAVQGSSRD